MVWAVVVHAADIPDGKQACRLVGHVSGYLPRMKKILEDQAYKTTFVAWVEAKIPSKPTSTKGFVPVKWKWVNERSFG
nr:hypothetical protein [uncultured Microscilla sp.]